MVTCGFIILFSAACATIEPVPLPTGTTPPPTAVPSTPRGADLHLTHGPVVGAVTDKFAKIFVRTDRAASVKIQYSTAPDLSNSARSVTQRTRKVTDFTTQIPLEHLQPNTTYYFNILVDDVPQLAAPYPQFKTFVPAGQAVPFKFVVLTDFREVAKPPVQVQTFARANQEQPAFVIIGGDFDHSNPQTIDERRQMFKNLYTPARGLEDFVNLILRRYPVAHMWDDHDYGADNADKTYLGKGDALEVLQEYFPVYPIPLYGDWQKFSYAQADFFLLDSRSERDPDSDPNGPGKSMLDGDQLGEAGQWVWLTQGLLKSQATWKFILTPVVFNRTVPKSDSWSGFPAERARLVKFIRDNNIHGVVFISGDLHGAAIDDGTNSDFPEMLVPGANVGGGFTSPETGAWTQGVCRNLNKIALCNGYGVVTVTTNPDAALLQTINEDGNVMQQLTVHP